MMLCTSLAGWEGVGSSLWGLFVLAARVCSVEAAQPRASCSVPEPGIARSRL